MSSLSKHDYLHIIKVHTFSSDTCKLGSKGGVQPGTAKQ